MNNVTLELTQQEAAILSAIVAIGNSIALGAARAFGDVRGYAEFTAFEARFATEFPEVNGEDVHPTNTLFEKLIPLAASTRENYPIEMGVATTTKVILISWPR